MAPFRSAKPWQPSLFEAGSPAFDRAFGALERRWLDEHAWIDFAPRWVSGSDTLFREIVAGRAWAQRTRRLYDQEVVEPRLTSPWALESGEPLRPRLLEGMRAVLSERYGVEFDSVGFNLYRDGRDSVAWHGDRIRHEIAQPIVVLVSLGEPRRFLLRRKSGGRSVRFLLGHGDLLATGGTTQRTWQHSVPKVVRAGPRLSLAFRHGMDRSGYGREPGQPSEPARGPIP